MKRHREDAKDIVKISLADVEYRSSMARSDASDGYRTQDFVTDREMLRVFRVTGSPEPRPEPDKPRPAPLEADWVTWEDIRG